MTKKNLYLLLALVGLLAASLACNAPGSEVAPTADLASIVAQTQTAVAVSQFLTATAAPGQPAAPGQGASPTAVQAQPVASATVGAPQVPAITQPPVVTQAPPASSSPLPPQQPNCTDAAKYESETIPDGSAFPPGQEFVKTWTLRNAGTCTWNADYALVFVNGEQMNGSSPSPIGQTVPPGNTIQIFLPQTAPANPGEHQGFWKLRSNTGREFGLGADASKAFWVKIVVVPGAAAPAVTPGAPPASAGAPTWTESFSPPIFNWYLGSDADTNYDIQKGDMIMTAFKPAGDQWRVALPSYVDNFLMQASFRTGPACSGKDGYGLILRAPEQPNNIINSGYVFAFSCAGEYRIYRMDKGNYVGLVNWTTSPFIKSGPNQDNVMSILAKGGKLQLSANGQLVAEISDTTYPGGLFGLVVRSENTQNFQAIVKEINFWNNPQ